MLLFQLGKGGDKYGYVRPEEEDVVRELRKVWEPATVSKEEVDRLKNQIDELKKGGLGPLRKETLRE